MLSDRSCRWGRGAKGETQTTQTLVMWPVPTTSTRKNATVLTKRSTSTAVTMNQSHLGSDKSIWLRFASNQLVWYGLMTSNCDRKMTAKVNPMTVSCESQRGTIRMNYQLEYINRIMQLNSTYCNWFGLLWFPRTTAAMRCSVRSVGMAPSASRRSRWRSASELPTWVQREALQDGFSLWSLNSSRATWGGAGRWFFAVSEDQKCVKTLFFYTAVPFWLDWQDFLVACRFSVDVAMGNNRWKDFCVQRRKSSGAKAVPRFRSCYHDGSTAEDAAADWQEGESGASVWRIRQILNGEQSLDYSCRRDFKDQQRIQQIECKFLNHFYRLLCFFVRGGWCFAPLFEVLGWSA